MVVKRMCHTGRPLGRPCKHCSVTALITEGGRDTGGGMETVGGGGGCDNEGDGGAENKRTGEDMESRRREGGREAKWEEHDLKTADERGGRNRRKQTA